MGATARWHVKEPVLLNEVIGRHPRPDGSEEVVLHGFIAIRGQVIEDKELAPAFVEAYESGDPGTRAMIERLDDGDQGVAKADDGLYDPSDHGVEDVLSYLRGADDDEVVRVLASEESGKARVTVLGYEPSTEDDED